MSPLALLKAAPWFIAMAAVCAALWFKAELADCQASVAIDAAKAAEAVRAQQERDAKFTRDLEETLRPIVRAVQEQGHAAQIALAKVKSDPNCGRTDAARAFDGIVQPRGGQAGTGAPNAAKP